MILVHQTIDRKMTDRKMIEPLERQHELMKQRTVHRPELLWQRFFAPQQALSPPGGFPSAHQQQHEPIGRPLPE